MLAVIDIKAELDKLARRQVSSATARRTSFAKLASFRDGGLFSARHFGETLGVQILRSTGSSGAVSLDC
jgi:hypothetical protein